MTKNNNQDLINGWIICSASHHYPLNDELTRDALTNYANQEIASGNHLSQWQEILNYCNSLPSGMLTLEQANKLDRKSTRLNSSHVRISYAVFCLKKKKKKKHNL